MKLILTTKNKPAGAALKAALWFPKRTVEFVTQVAVSSINLKPAWMKAVKLLIVMLS
jgi:hypothetical protein